MRRPLALAGGILALLLPSAAAAQWRLFLPRFVDVGATLELFGARESDEQSSDRFGTQGWQDDFLREKLTLSTEGYVYHPKFLSFRLALAGALKQETYDATWIPQRVRSEGDAYEYDARLYVLPGHVTHGELFARRYEPVYRQENSLAHSALDRSWGGEVEYERANRELRARYTDTRTDYEASWNEVQALGVTAGLVHAVGEQGRMTWRAEASPSRFSTSAGGDGESSRYGLGNLFAREPFRLDSSLSLFTARQHGADLATRDSSQLLLIEQGSWRLPHHFRADANLRSDRSRTDTARRDAAALRLESNGTDADFTLEHHLFESLTSRYRYAWSRRESDTGTSEGSGHSLGFEYSKRIPHGRLGAGLGVARNDTSSRGAAATIDEGHPGVAVPGAFELAIRRNVDPATIAVWVVSPVAPFALLPLDEGLHYTVNPVGEAWEVRVLTLPAPLAVPGTFEFRVSYALAGSFEARTDTLTHNATVELLERRLNPYYRFVRTTTDTLAGDFVGAGPEAKTLAAGVTSYLGRFRAQLEYQRFEAEIAPHESWRGDLGWYGAAGPFTFSTSASWLTRDFTDDAGALFASEDIGSGSFSLQYRPVRHFLWSLGGSWSDTRRTSAAAGDSDATAWTATSGLMWKVGLLEVNGGATLYRSSTRGGVLLATERSHEYYFLSLRRTLF